MAALSRISGFRAISIAFLVSVVGTNIYIGAFLFVALFLGLNCLTLRSAQIIGNKILFCILLGVMTGYLLTYYQHTIHAQKRVWLEQTSGYGQSYVSLDLEIKRMRQVDTFSKKYSAQIFSINGVKAPRNTNIVVIIPKNLTLIPRQQLTLSGQLSFPENESSIFQHATWLSMQHIYAEIYARTLPEKPMKNSSSFFAKIRQWGEVRIQKIYPEKHAIFLSGILLGERRSLSQETKDQFIHSGLMHIIAVSGFNITILILFARSITRFFPKWIEIFLVLAMICMFVGIVGYQVPVVRAAIIGSVNYLALSSGSRIRIFHLLLASLIFFAILNPLALVFDLSLILSYLSVLGIILFQKFFSDIFRMVPNILELRSALIMTLSSLVFTLPISIVYFERFSIISPISNILAGAAIPPAMLFGFLSIITVSVFESIAMFLGWIGWLFLNYILEVVSWSGTRSWSSVETFLGVFRWHFFWIYMIIISYVGIRFYQKQQQQK